MDPIRDIFAQQIRAMLVLSGIFTLVIVLTLIGLVYLWGRTATCASLGSSTLANIFFYVNPHLDADHDGIPCEILLQSRT